VRQEILFPGTFDIPLRRFAHTEVFGGYWFDGLLIEAPVVRVRPWTITKRLYYLWRSLRYRLDGSRGPAPMDRSYRAAHVCIDDGSIFVSPEEELL
jgi:hypothetical protein